jgi:subtilisin family serine protease
VAATVRADVVNQLASLPGLESIVLDAVIRQPVATEGTTAAPEWNLSAIHAPSLWNLGFTGQGVVVANMDSGVDGDHPDLQTRWRGGANSWFDPNGEHSAPYDADGHGTQTMGLMVGGDTGGMSVGVAPGAQWVAVKIFNDAGDASYSAIHLGYQWLLDPDGDPDTDDAPDVVNNSWGLDNTGTCVTEFQADVQALRAANIAVVFASGNSGPNAATSVSPANYPESFSVGAVDSTNTLLPSSSRGPSACYGDHYPSVVAPGVDVLTTDLYLGIPGAYVSLSGTSFAAPHVAGALALLIGAFPFLDAQVIDTALINSTADLGAPGPDNDHGYGMVDVLGAYRFLSTDRMGVYESGIWYQDLNGNGSWDGAATDRSALFGADLTEAVPVAGDWAGTGATGIGVYDQGTWYLDLNGNGSWDGAPLDGVYIFGAGLQQALPVTGDWNGTGVSGVGVYDRGIWYLDLNGNGAWDGTPTDALYTFGVGLTGAVPVTGDWDGTGIAKAGLFVPATGQWFLDTNGNGAWDSTPTDTLSYFGSGLVGTVPVTGDWNGSGMAKVGLFVPSTGEWFLDADGSGAWNGAPTDTLAYFGQGLTGIVPVSGKW